jgi:hypothetical protein
MSKKQKKITPPETPPPKAQLPEGSANPTFEENNYTIRPGMLVGLKTRIQGGVTYSTSEESLERDGCEEDKTWRTLRHVEDVEELASATEVRNKAGSLIRLVCIPTPFGLVCPKERRTELGERITDAQKRIQEHNKTAVHTKIDLYVIQGEIADNDKQAVLAILSEVRDALDEMKRGVETVNVKTIRDAALKAKNIGQMLPKDQEERVSKAVAAARSAARLIAKRIEKGGELASIVLKEISMKPIDDLRFSFLDMEDAPKKADGGEALPIMAELQTD